MDILGLAIIRCDSGVRIGWQEIGDDVSDRDSER